ncbi:MAG: 30S ribosome-binding factor RbfA [Chitinophagales bacterium]|nr:30S ribosome-binding factor RbfA [Chitinophagales bacterium]
MADILLKDAKDYLGSSTLASITQVKISPDMSVAKFYISIFGKEDAQMDIDILNSTSTEWRRKLGNELKNHLRKIPEIEFFLDDSMEYAQKMNTLFNNIKKDSPTDEEE